MNHSKFIFDVRNMHNDSGLLSLADDLITFNLSATSIILFVLYVPMFLLGFFGNIVITLLVLTNEQLRNSTNLYLCNMAVTDLSGKIYLSKMAVASMVRYIAVTLLR